MIKNGLERIASFSVDHTRLLPGIYVSRKDNFSGQVLTTFDLRFTRPNVEPAMDTAAVHAIEHLGATFLRNHLLWKDRTVYFGPMGCRTGFYVIFHGDLDSRDILPVMREMSSFVLFYTGPIPGASARECGNYLDLNLDTAKYYFARFQKEVLLSPVPARLIYPGADDPAGESAYA